MELKMTERRTGLPQSLKCLLEALPKPSTFHTKIIPFIPFIHDSALGQVVSGRVEHFRQEEPGSLPSPPAQGAADAGSEPRPRTPSTPTMEPRDKEGDLQLRTCQPRANHGGFRLGPALDWPQLRATCPTCSWLIRSLQQGPRGHTSPRGPARFQS